MHELKYPLWFTAISFLYYSSRLTLCSAARISPVRQRPRVSEPCGMKALAYPSRLQHLLGAKSSTALSMMASSTLFTFLSLYQPTHFHHFSSSLFILHLLFFAFETWLNFSLLIIFIVQHGLCFSYLSSHALAFSLTFNLLPPITMLRTLASSFSQL